MEEVLYFIYNALILNRINWSAKRINEKASTRVCWAQLFLSIACRLRIFKHTIPLQNIEHVCSTTAKHKRDACKLNVFTQVSHLFHLVIWLLILFFFPICKSQRAIIIYLYLFRKCQVYSITVDHIPHSLCNTWNKEKCSFFWIFHWLILRIPFEHMYFF